MHTHNSHRPLIPVILGDARHTLGSKLPADCDVQQAQGGRGRWESAQSSLRGANGRGREGLMARGRGYREHTQARAPELPRPGCMLDLSLHHPLSILGINYLIAPGRSQKLEGGRRRSAEAWRAGEAAFDAKYQQNPQKTDCDIVTFPTALTASELTNPLIEANLVVISLSTEHSEEMSREHSGHPSVSLVA